jgi:hypothetical protein
MGLLLVQFRCLVDVFVNRVAWYRIAASQPSPQIDIGAAT